jgi:general secretion pathway protein G
VNDTRADYRVALLLCELVKSLPLFGIFAAVAAVALLGPSAVVSQFDQAARHRASLELGSIRTALKLYQAKTGALPSSRQGLRALVEKGVLERLPEDPWGNTYGYALNGSDVVLRSPGPDGRLGGRGVADDIVLRIPGRQLQTAARF